VLGGGLALLALLAGMDPDARAERESDAIRSEDLVPVVELLAAIHERFADGRVLKLDLEREGRPSGAIWVYEVKILMPNGDVFEVEYNARSLELLDVEGPGED
jgi:uncharacterized membrane protein YkoI